MDENRQTEPRPDRFVFWLRFVCGAILGMFLYVRLYLLMYMYDHPLLLLILAVGLILGCGLAAAKYGDRFWGALFDRE